MDIEKLIEQLHIAGAGNTGNIFDEAADALKQLRAENEKLRAENIVHHNAADNYYAELAECREERNEALAELEQAKAERDAVVKDLRVCSIENRMECQYCLYRTARVFCWNCTDSSNWKFRGQKED